MKKSKKVFLIALVLFLMVNYMPINALSNTYTVSNYNVTGDTDRNGNNIVDIRDLVRAEKLALWDSSFYNSIFFDNLIDVLLGFKELPVEEESGAEGIYLPEIP